MNPDKKTLAIRIVTFLLIVIAIVVLMRVVVGANKVTTEYDGFAQCLAEKDVKFYGAFWCPHCQAQKRAFGGSAKLLPYIECSTPDGKGTTQICKEAGITGYPTWVFPDGSRESGEVELPVLAEKSGCALPASSSDRNSKISIGEESAVVQ